LPPIALITCRRDSVPRIAFLLCLLSTWPLVASPADAAVPAALAPVHGKVVWVDFWASWCSPCRRSFPWLNEMQRRYGKQGLEIIAVNLDEDRKLANEFLAETPALFEVRFDPSGHLAKEFDVQAMPSSYLLDSSGKVLGRHLGFKLADAGRYEKDIRSALSATEVGSRAEK
jgi:cytochrome c biogenesis protein CcmG/thiol:disulfide interchange protein DsbE